MPLSKIVTKSITDDAVDTAQLAADAVDNTILDLSSNFAGLKLGGTGSANTINDYEIGTFDPVYRGGTAAGSVTYNSQRTGVYTKIGRVVRVWVDMNIGAMSGASGNPQCTLPFTSSNELGSDVNGSTRYEMGTFVGWAISDNFTNSKRATAWIANNENYITVYSWAGDTTAGHQAWSINTTGRISFSFTYTTNN